MEVKNVQYGRVTDYMQRAGGNIKFLPGVRPWGVKADVALPCACENELDENDAKTLIANGVKCVAEGANMPSTIAAAKAFEAAGVLYAPGKASKQRLVQNFFIKTNHILETPFSKSRIF